MKIGYGRVSTVGQELANQIEDMRAAGCEKLFLEKKSGKAGAERPELRQSIEFAREGDVFVVTRLDRLARSVFDLHKIGLELQRKGVELVVLQQQLDTTTPAGRLLFTMLGAVAEFERDLINERVTEGRRKAQERGVKFGRRKALDADQLAALKRDMEAEPGVGREEMAKRHGISRATLFRAVQPGK